MKEINVKKMKIPTLNATNVLLLLCSALSFWYVYFSIGRKFIGMRGTRVFMEKDPILFWLSITFILCIGCYSMILLFFKKE